MERTALTRKSSSIRYDSPPTKLQNKKPYVSHTPDMNGVIDYSQDEHHIWQTLLVVKPSKYLIGPVLNILKD